MTVDYLFEIALEASIEGRCGAVSFRQRDRFGEQAAWLRFRWTQDRYGPCIIFDDDFSAGTHVRQELRNVGRSGFLLRDVDHILGHKRNYTSRQARARPNRSAEAVPDEERDLRPAGT
jgi:hypothetical protein